MKLTAYIHRVLDVCDDMLASLPGGPGKTAPERDQRAIAMDLVIRAMAVMCAADGKLEEQEIDESVQLYNSKTGYTLSEDQIRMTVSSVSLDSDVFWSDLRVRAQLLPQEIRREIYDAAYSVAMADDELHPNETTVLDRLASTMGHAVA